MDVFFEQIVKKKTNALQKALKIGFIVTAIILIVLVFIYSILLMGSGSPVNSIISSLLLLACFGIGYYTRWYVKRLYLEYEYSITNGDFDIDRIIGKAKRERIISTNCKDFEEFGVYDENAIKKLEEINSIHEQDIKNNQKEISELRKIQKELDIYHNRNNDTL